MLPRQPGHAAAASNKWTRRPAAAAALALPHCSRTHTDLVVVLRRLHRLTNSSSSCGCCPYVGPLQLVGDWPVSSFSSCSRRRRALSGPLHRLDCASARLSSDGDLLGKVGNLHPSWPHLVGLTSDVSRRTLLVNPPFRPLLVGVTLSTLYPHCLVGVISLPSPSCPRLVNVASSPGLRSSSSEVALVLLLERGDELLVLLPHPPS